VGEADLLNIALFGMTAAEWRKANPNKDGNMRDHATIEQLLVLANLENVNALYIWQGYIAGRTNRRTQPPCADADGETA